MKRAIKLAGINKELELGKVTAINHLKSNHEFINIEKMKDGKWRMTYTADTIPDIKELQSLQIIRED